MMEIIANGPDEYEGELCCPECGTVFLARTADLGIDGFKNNPNTYWFDGSAVAVDKFYAWCPHGCDLVFIPDASIPVLAQRRAIRGLSWAGNRDRGKSLPTNPEERNHP